MEITEDANNDGFINKAELDGTVGVKVGLPTAAVAGDLLVVTATGNAQQSIELTQAMIDAKSVTVEFNPLPDGSKMDVTAKVTDKAGNASNVATDSATFALSEPGAPGVTIKLDTDNDGFINAKEKGSATTTDVEIKISADAKDGDVITVTDQAGNVLATYTVGQNGVTAGSTQTTQASLPADGETLKVTASVKDAAGNPGASGSDSAKMDTTVFEGLAVEITEDANNDGYISAAELQGAVDVRVTLPKGAAVGDVLTVTGSGNVDQNFTLTQAQLDQGYIDVAFGTAPVNNTDFKATATIKDTAGNTAGPVEDKAKVLLQASGAPTVTITEDANNDGLISKAELEGEIGVSITLPAGAKAGDTLLVSANGTVLTPIMLTAADISKGSVSVPGIVSPGEGNTLTVTAQVKDAAGNLSPEGKDSAVIDTTAPNAPAVKILDGGDELLNSSEVAAGVKAEISLADTGAVKGDVLNVDTNGDGVIDRTITLTEEQITAGKVIVDVPAAQVPANGILTVKASITDIAGNPGQTGSDTSVVDTTAPTIDIQAIAGESQNPLGTDADSYATINIKDKSDGFAVSGVTNAEDGQVVTVKVYDGTTEVSSITTTVTNGTWSANVPAGATWIADTKVYKFEATVADKAGNTNSDEDLTKATDLVAPDNSTTTLKIDSITTDNILNAAEAKTNINVTGTVSGDEFKAGDTVTLTVNGKDFSGEVDKDGKFTIAVPGSDLAADDDTTVAGKVEVTDAAGNTGTATATQKYGVDITAPTIDIQTIAGESQSPLTTDADNYATINLKDKTDGFKVSGTTDAEDGQVVTIKVNNGTADVASFTATVTGGIWSADVPANESWVTDGTVYSFTASVADKAGNTATDTDKTAATDITPPNKDTTTLTITSVAGDDVVNKTESTAAEVPVVGKVTGEFKVDDIVTLKVNNVEYTGKVTADGSFTINVKGADLLADGDKVVDASITTTDAAGNSGTIETTHQYKVDTSVAIDINQIAGENQVTEGTDGYATINLKDKTDSFKVSGTTDAEDGQVVTIKVNNGTADVASFTATVTGGTWSADVPANESWVTDGTVYSFTASVADKAGNTATDTDKTAATDITPPNKDTTTLTITSVAGDDVVNKTESTSTEVPVVGKVTGEFKVDDIVTLKVNNVDYTGKVAADGSFTINVKGADLLADGDKMVDASITTTDAAGNSGTIETTHQYKVDTSVAIDINQIAGENQVAEGTDGYATINQKDKTDGFKVSGTTDAEDGQIVTVTVTAEGSTTVLGSFTATVATGAWSVDVPKAAAWITDGTVYSFTASVSDKAGNTATDIDKTVATDLTAPTIDIQTIANESQAPLATDADGYATINIKDKADGFAVSGVTTAEVGQTVTVTVLKDGVAVDGVNLTATVTATGSWSAAVPANADWIVDKAVYSFVATVADKAGNTASDTDVTKATDLVAPDNSTTTLTIDSITADNVLNAAEAKTSINVTGTVSGNEFKAGDKVTLTVNGKDFTGTVDANGKFSIAVPGSDLAADNDTTVAGKVEVTDAAGNVGTATANREYGIDITAPTIDINHIAGESQVTEGTDNYAVITKADAQAGFVISGVTTGVEDGQKVSIYILDANGSVALQSYVGVATVTGNKWSYSVGANQIPGGAAYTIKAEVSDVAGNLDSDTDKTAVPPPTLAASAVAVSEEGLTNVSALPDNLGLAGADTTNFAKASGTMAVTDATSVVFSATGQPTTLGGTAVTWTGTGTQTLTAKDSSGATVLTATIDNHGDYVVTLNSAIKHPVNGTTPATSEDAVNVVLKATATGAGGSTTADLTVSIEDDSPTSGKTINLSSGLPQQDTNLIFVVDLTTTMDERDVNTPDTRIEMAKTALSALLDVYAGMGNVKVTLIGYRDKYAETLQTWTDASTMKTKWMTVGSAGLDTFDVSTSTGLTGYTAIPAETSTAWSKAGKITSSTNPIKNVAYVFTDGDVTGDSLTSTQVNTWVNFLKTNSITSNAYAVGTETASINLTEMGKLAYDGATSTDTNAVRVPNMNDLKGVLLASATPPISGSLLDPTPDVDGNAMISAGADGFGSVTSIVVDGKTYTYNKDTDTPSANTSSIASFNNITKAWTITYTTGAVLTVDMDDATYSYKIGTNTPAAGDKFSFTMADKDGDKGTNTFSFFKNKIDINSIAGEDQGTTDKDLYATISAADIAAGVAVKGITYDIPSGKAVTITVKDASEATVGTLSATVASDGTWSATAPANATWLKANTYYSFTASVTDSSGTAYTDKDVVNYAAQVKSVDSVTVTEGAYLEHLVTLSAGSMPTTATVKLTAGSATLDADLLQGASSGTVQVQYSLDGGIKWTTQSVAVTSGVAQFDVAVPAYASSFLVSTKSVADTLNEGAETYTVSVTTGSATQSGTGTINNLPATQTLEGNAVTEGGLLDLRRADNGMDNTTGTKSDTDGKTNNWLNEFVVTTDIANSGGVTIRTEPGLGFTETNSPLTGGLFTGTNPTGMLAVFSDYENPALGITSTQYQQNAAEGGQLRKLMLVKEEAVRVVQGETLELNFDAKTINADKANAINVQFVLLDSTGKTVSQTGWYSTDGQSVSYYDGMGTVSKVLGKEDGATVIGTDWGMQSAKFDTSTLATGDYQLGINYSTNQVALQVSTADRPSDPAARDLLIDRIALSDATITGTDNAEMLIGFDNSGATKLATKIYAQGGDDFISISNTMIEKIDGGAGKDTLQLSAPGLTLDLTQQPQDVIKNIEVVDLSASGNQTLKLTYQDLLDMSGNGSLQVDGKAGDGVQISNGAVAVTATTQEIHGITYNAYNLGGSSEADLLVQQGVTVSFVL
ncbi:Ig-like domain-containing protein [Testudinibacter aquarius]|uniref:Ig-like domain-containing protein n=1 Tax=Testudinibacter aquarius TaxID=1524974 RepID=UPI001AD7FE70|nr:Ig-like domain-containing protein [Testudinibacter aquarius]